MRRAPPILVLAAALAWTAPASAESLTMALSTGEVRINSNFTGAPVTVFGVIERDSQTVSRVGHYRVATLVEGPPESVVVRRKDRVAGVWANTDSETILAAPSFYLVNSSGEIDDLAAKELLERYRLGFDNARFNYRNRTRASAPQVEEFREAFLRIMDRNGLYTENEEAVDFIGDNIFRTTVWVPSNAPVGYYRVRAFLFAEGTLIARAEDSFRVTKTGFEAYMSTFSRDKSFVYGFLCVALALFTGWLGGVIFRRD